MRKILLLSHGKFAEGILNSLSLFFGETHNFSAISAYSDGVEPEDELKKFFSLKESADEVIICSDILGGSVNQYALPYLNEDNVYIIAGFNFPLLLELGCLPESTELTIELLESIIEKSKKSIVLMNTYEVLHNDNDE